MKKKTNNSRGMGISLSYVNTFFNMVTGLFLSAFFLRFLGDTEYGVYQTVSSFANYLVLLEFGTGTIMSRNIAICRARNASKEEIEKNISTIWTITNVLALIITVVSVIFYFSLDKIYAKTLDLSQIAEAKKIFIVITVYLVGAFYLQTLNKITIGFEHYPYISKLSITKVVSRTVLFIIFIPLLKQSIIIAAVDAAIVIVQLAYSFLYCKRKFNVHINFKGFDKGIFKAVLPLCAAIFIQGLVNQANGNVAKFIIGIKLGPEMVALYSIAVYIYFIFSSLTIIPVSMYVPQVAKSVVSGLKGEKLVDCMIQPSRLIVLIGGTIFFGFFAAGKQFISIVYGEQYLQAWSIAIIIMSAMYFSMSTGILMNVLDAMNKRLSRSIVLLVTTALNVVLTTIWLDKYGIIGAAASTAICTFLGEVVIMDIYYVKAIKIKLLYMYRKTFKGILLYQVLGAAVAYIAGQYISNIYISFFVSGVVYVLISFGSFMLVGKSEEEKNMIKGILKKIKK